MNDLKHPDPLLHRNISFAKSFVRIVAGLALALAGLNMHSDTYFYFLDTIPMGNAPIWIVVGGLALVAAEVLGIVEEMV